MLDVALTEDSVTGEFDLSIEGSDFAGTEGLETAILLSLLSDGRASDDQVATPQFRRGWIGDAVPAAEGYRIGSLLWLVEPSKATQQTMNIAAAAAQEALQWLLDAGIADDVQVSGEITGPRTGTLTIDITAPDGGSTTQYVQLWENTAFAAGDLAPRIVESVPFDPTQVAGLVAYGDARDSDHTIDALCRVEVAQDIAGNAAYSQSIDARRPLRIEGSGGWLYRFSGGQFLTTANQALQSLASGSLFIMYKPTGDAVAGRRFFSLGSNGSADSVGGLAFVQAAADAVQMLGASGDLDVSVIGPASNGAPVGIVFRWGPGSSGGDVETSDLVAASDASYSPEVSTISQATFGAGFDGSDADVATAAGFESNLFAIYSRRVDDVDVLNLLGYAGTRIFTSPVGEPFDDCRMPADDFGFVDG